MDQFPLQLATFVLDRPAIPIAISATILTTMVGNSLAETRGALARLPEPRPNERLVRWARKLQQTFCIAGETAIAGASAAVSLWALGAGVSDAPQYGYHTIAAGAGFALFTAAPAAAVIGREMLNRQGSLEPDHGVHPASYKMALRQTPSLPSDGWVQAAPKLDLRAPLIQRPSRYLSGGANRLV